MCPKLKSRAGVIYRWKPLASLMSMMHITVKREGGTGRREGPSLSELPDVPDNAYHDGGMTDLAIDQLKEFKSTDQTIFHGCGLQKTTPAF